MPVGPGDKVACYLYNGAPYLEAVFAAFKLGAVPVNANYRYTQHELTALLADADAAALVFSGELAANVTHAAQALPSLRLLVRAGAIAPGTPAASREVVLNAPELSGLYATTGPRPRQPRPASDQLFMYTGGTTGKPKGVIWPLADLMRSMGASAFRRLGVDQPPATLAEVAEIARGQGRRPVPGGAVRRAADARDRPVRLPGRAARRRPGGADPARPARPAACLGGRAKAAGPHAHRGGQPSRFYPAAATRVLTADGEPVIPGSGAVGTLAFGGPVPVGYYKDAAKTSATVRTFGDVRYSMPGDLAIVEADGAIRFLGRGAGVINTGGEKVHPQEVEDILLAHPKVTDASVVGVPDETWGERVVAVVATRSKTLTGEDLRAAVRRLLAGYKVPRAVILLPALPRTPAGKLELARVRDIASAGQAPPAAAPQSASNPAPSAARAAAAGRPNSAVPSSTRPCGADPSSCHQVLAWGAAPRSPGFRA